MAMQDLTSLLDREGVDYVVLTHGHTERAADEAQALGLAPQEVAKTIVVATPAGNVRAVLPASERIDLRKLGELHGETRKHVQLLSEDELRRDYPEFELGAVPPLGGGHSDLVVVDAKVAEQDSVVLEAGSHDESIRLASADLVRLTAAQVADICAD